MVFLKNTFSVPTLKVKKLDQASLNDIPRVVKLIEGEPGIQPLDWFHLRLEILLWGTLVAISWHGAIRPHSRHWWSQVFGEIRDTDIWRSLLKTLLSEWNGPSLPCNSLAHKNILSSPGFFEDTQYKKLKNLKSHKTKFTSMAWNVTLWVQLEQKTSLSFFIYEMDIFYLPRRYIEC